MNTEYCESFKSKQPSCSGTGLVTLDVLVNGKEDNQRRLWTGGSCGNVLIILSSLGWKTSPIVCLGEDSASQIIIDDMKNWDVNTDLIFRSSKVSSPIIVERLYNDGESVFHEFKFKCPFCGSPLPRTRPLPSEFLEEAKNKMPCSNVFYFDRASASATKLAKKAKAQGALVVFEPHKLGTRKIFDESVELADIVKYSREQIETDGLSKNAFLEVQTMGAKGLRYKFRSKKGENAVWKEKEAFQVHRVVDSAGAGDWCTAGLINSLCRQGLRSLQESKIEEIESAFDFSQRLAALKCCFEGPRGLMYNLNATELCFFLQNAKLDNSSQVVSLPNETFGKQGQIPLLCPSCFNKKV
jgi:fructokinase